MWLLCARGRSSLRKCEIRERWSLCSLYICERDAHPVPPLGKTRDSPDNRTPVEANCIFSLPARQTVSACIFQLSFTTLLSRMNVFKFVAKQPQAQGKERLCTCSAYSPGKLQNRSGKFRGAPQMYRGPSMSVNNVPRAHARGSLILNPKMSTVLRCQEVV